MNDQLQRTEEWYQERLGMLTGSVVKDVTETLKNGAPTAKYQQRMMTILAERLTGVRNETYTSKQMLWGTEHEGDAIARYEVETGNFVNEVGFIKHPTIEGFGASPDGLVGDDGQIEVKCPDTTTHINRLLADVVPEEYKPQMIAQLLCTGRKWVDFIDYDPRIQEPKLQIFIKRFTPSEEEKNEVKTKILNFLNELLDKQIDLQNKGF